MEEERGNVPGKSLPAPIALPISDNKRWRARHEMRGWINGEKDRERETGEKKEEN